MASQEEQIQNLKELALRYSALQQPERAAPIFQLALQIAEKTFEPYSEVIIGLRIDIGCFYISFKPRPPEIQEFCRLTIDLCERVFGYSHRVTLGAVRNFIVLVCTENVEEFPSDYERLLKRAIEGYENYHGADNMMRVDLLEILAILLEKEGRLFEAENILEERVGLLKLATGLANPKTERAAVNLALHYWQRHSNANQNHTSIDPDPSHQLVVRVLDICIEYVSARQTTIHLLGRMLMYSGDDENAGIAFYHLLSNFGLQFGCNGCNNLIIRHDVHAHCRRCKVVDLCQPCRDLYRIDGSCLAQIPAECRNHEFFESNLDQVQDVDLEIWLGEVHKSKSKPARGKGYDDTNHNSDFYLGQNLHAIYIFPQVSGLPDDLGEGSLQDKSQAWIENLERCVRDTRILQVREIVPQMLSNWFPHDGRQQTNLSQTRLLIS